MLLTSWTAEGQRSEALKCLLNFLQGLCLPYYPLALLLAKMPASSSKVGAQYVGCYSGNITTVAKTVAQETIQ